MDGPAAAPTLELTDQDIAQRKARLEFVADDAERIQAYAEASIAYVAEFVEQLYEHFFALDRSVDLDIANHLLQIVETCRLVGAAVLATGGSPDVAQKLVGVGSDLERFETFGALQSGLEEAERRLSDGGRAAGRPG